MNAVLNHYESYIEVERNSLLNEDEKSTEETQKLIVAIQNQLLKKREKFYFKENY
ncbi:hypothetical protein [Rossellomorea aquimaris]|uniref:hypothetical protein n=1 Tax=Rossellomorea aquimaris TaxID=189382 RepID=UPI000B0C91D0|nr:hypothetical protein [Rossellomorea aquimaris]